MPPPWCPCCSPLSPPRPATASAASGRGWWRGWCGSGPDRDGDGSGWPLLLIAGTFAATRRVPVALEQINLKVPPRVASHWRSQAAANGLSVRDWLISATLPAASPPAPSAGLDLAEQLTALADRVARLEALGPAAPVAPVAAEPPPPRPAPVAQPDGEALPPGAIETSELAKRLEMRRGTLNARIGREGGPRPDLVFEGWRCVGFRTPDRGGPPRALWVPAES